MYELPRWTDAPKAEHLPVSGAVLLASSHLSITA